MLDDVYRMMGKGVAWPKHPFLIKPCAQQVDAAARRIKPDVIFSIPIDPKSESAAYKKAAAAGIKLVFLDNVPVDMAPGKDYVSVVAADNEKNAFFAADELAKAIGSKGEVGILTLVYDFYYSVAARKVGALKAFAQYPDIKVVGVGTFTSPEKAYEVATSMLTANPNLKGLFVAWDTPAQQAVAAMPKTAAELMLAAWYTTDGTLSTG